MKLYFVISLLCITIYSRSQNGMPAFGKIDKTELERTDCEYDKGAEAEVLIDWGNTYYDRGTSGISLFKTLFEHRRRIKILKEKGFSQADITIPYYSYNNEEKIVRVKAFTYNLDGKGGILRTEAGKNSVYIKKINKYFSEFIIAFPKVRAGSVIEYRYTLERETMGQLRNWYFQEKIPVRYSRYQLTIPQIFRFSVQPSIVDSIEEKKEVINELISVDKGLINTKSLRSNYVMRKLPGIKEEPYISTPKDYMQRLEFQLSQIDYGNGDIQDLRTSWSDVMQDLNKDPDFGGQLEKNIDAAEAFIKEAKLIEGEEEKLQFIYNHLRKNFTWNENKSIYCSKSLSKIWEAKTGNTADINLLLVKLLNETGLKAAPILFSTRDNGLVNSSFPFLQQFNIVMAHVTTDNNSFVLDATDKYATYNLIPYKITNSQGFIAEGKTGKWKDVFSGKNKHKVVTAIRGEIDTDASIKGDALVTCFDYAKKQRCEKWTKSTADFATDYFFMKGMPCKTTDLIVNNVNADSLPLEQKVKFAGNLNGTGNYRYFTINHFTGLNNNPFMSETRASDIDFGCTQEYIIFGSYIISSEYAFEGLPANTTIIMPDTSVIFSRSVQQADNLLTIRISIEFKRPFYSANVYPEFADFYKKMFAKLNEQIVIKKKSN